MTARPDGEASTRSGIREFVQLYPTVHLVIGLVGDVAFVVGSVLFLFQQMQTPATWLFIAGSTGLLIASLGQALLRHEQHRLRQAQPGSRPRGRG